MNLHSWWLKTWPRFNDRRQLAAEYTQLGSMTRLLADIANRGGVFHTGQSAADLYEAGKLAGRRELAIETIRIAGTDPAILQKLCLEPLKPETSR